MTENGKERSCLVGAKQVRRALRDGIAEKILFARDADPALIEPLLDVCQEQSVPAEPVRSMRELGHLCGIETKAAIAAFVRKN